MADTDLIVDPGLPDLIVVTALDAEIAIDLPDDTLTLVFEAVGLPGRDGADGGLIVGIAGQALSGQRAVRHDATGLVVHGDPRSAVGAQIIGVSVGAALMGAPVSVLSSGEMTEPSWTWSAGPIFLGANGMLTQSAPATGILVVVGYAAGPIKMVVAPRIVADLG